MPRKRTRTISVAVSVVLVAYGVYLLRHSFPKLFGAISRTDPMLSAAAFLAFLVATLVIAVRLRLVFSIVGVQGLFMSFAYYTLVAMFTSSFFRIPGGAAVVTGVLASRDRKQPFQVCLVAGIADRLIGMLTAPLFAAAGLWILVADSETTWKATLLALLALTSVSGAVVLTAVIPKGSPPRRAMFNIFRRFHLAKLARALSVLLQSPKKLLLSAFLTVVVFGFYSLAAYLLTLALGFEVPFIIFPVLIPTLSVAMVLPSVGGWGVRETVFIVLLRPYLSLEEALAVSLLYYGITLATGLVGGIALIAGGGSGFSRFERTGKGETPDRD